MKVQVENTIDNSIEFFNSLEEAKTYIEGEIKWFNSPKENKKGNGYDESDFIINEINE